MVNIVISGEAGQGIESAQEMLVKILHHKKYHVFAVSEYMSRIRGGTNSALIKVTEGTSPYFENRIDYLFILDEKVKEHLKERIDARTHFIDAKKSNIYAVGYIVSLFNIDPNECVEFLKQDYGKIFDIAKNNEAFYKGYEYGKNSGIYFDINPDTSLWDKKVFAGNMTLALGSIAGGANFVSFYPMSPGTGIYLDLAHLADEFNIICEQAEDEIAVINMALGASYCGARSCVTTSGGGFALMSEAIGLAGMTETPVVVHIGQRPGPVTGLPTRTAQEDFNLALYAGNGEFERIILSPATIEDSFEIAQMAFEQAQKYQLPVFILSEQCLLESFCAVNNLEAQENNNYIIKSDANYKRYQLSESPISPLAVPSYGDGLVCLDSDEHDEQGWITEDMNTRVQMVEKRLKKGVLLKHDVLPPYFIGSNEYQNLIISWGSNFEVLKAAISKREGFALLHYRQVYPITDEILNFTKDKKVITVEQNATGQFEKFLMREFGLACDHRLLKYNGLPFAIEEVERFLDEI